MEILKSIPEINNQLTIREIGEDIIILSEDDLEIHNLEGTAVFLWKCINGKSTVKQILKKLCDEYEVSSEQAESDVIEFFKECKIKKLVSFLHEKKD